MNRWKTCLLGLVAILSVTTGGQRVSAHEGHAALPSTGVTVDGDQLLISPAAMQAIEVRTEPVRLGDLERTLRVNARVELPWTGQAKVTALTAGRILQVAVEPGQSVTAGQELAQVESLELDLLQAELLQTADEVELASRLVEQRQALASSGGISSNVLLESQTNLRQKQAQLEVVEQKLKALGLDNRTIEEVRQTGRTVRSIPVTSPIAGSIESIDSGPGQLVEATDHLIDVVDLSKVYVVGEVLEGDAYLVRPGLPVTITFAGPSQVTVSGHVDHVRMKMDLNARSLQAVVVVDNLEGTLQPGMFGRMAIQVAGSKQQILCPSSALIETQAGTFVLKREGQGKFSLQPVTVGMQTPTWVVAQSGLFPGQQVISRGTHVLAAMLAGTTTSATGAESESKESVADPTTGPPKDAAGDRVLAAAATLELPTNQKALATSLIEGRVAMISVAPGQIVQAGDVLAEVESQQLGNLQLQLLQASARFEWTQATVDRLRPLAQSGRTPAAEFWQWELELKTLTQQVASLQRRLALIGLNADEIQKLSDGTALSTTNEPSISRRIAIRSPITGRIADIGVTLGQIVHAHDRLFEIHNTDTVWIKAVVLEQDAARMAIGRDAIVTFPSYPELQIRGTVVRLAPQLVSQERVLPLWIELTNPEGLLREGMLARVELLVPREPQTAGTGNR